MAKIRWVSERDEAPTQQRQQQQQIMCWTRGCTRPGGILVAGAWYCRHHWQGPVMGPISADEGVEIEIEYAQDLLAIREQKPDLAGQRLTGKRFRGSMRFIAQVWQGKLRAEYYPAWIEQYMIDPEPAGNAPDSVASAIGFSSKQPR